MKPSYNCSQDNLYAALTLAWQLYNEDQAAFASYKTKYTAAFGTAAVTRLTAARNLPDSSSREAIPEAARLELHRQAEDVLRYHNHLIGYIEDAFPREEWDVREKEAGHDHYERARHDVWSEVLALGLASMRFVETYAVRLELNDNMPSAFHDEFQTELDEFTTVYDQYGLNKESSQTGTTQKLTANNACYEEAILMLRDGNKRVFTNPERARLYIFQNLLDQVRGHHPSGVRGFISNPQGFPLPGLTVSILGSQLTTTTDEEGRYQLTVPAGKHTLQVRASHIEPLDQQVLISTGTRKRQNLTVTPI